MIKKTITIVASVCICLITINNCKSTAKEKVYKIGDRGPSGGFIFYDKGDAKDGWRYIEAAPVDQSNGIIWGCRGISINGAKGSGIGDGRSNTIAIIKNCNETNIAAKLCTSYRGGGKSDWFLPSKDELKLMYIRLYKAGIGNFQGYGYWSSSEGDAEKAWFHIFEVNYCGYNLKDSGRAIDDSVQSGDGCVRAVRVF